MSEQKMREALLKVAFSVELAERERNEARKAALFKVAEKQARDALAAPVEPSGNSGEFASTAGEQVGLTDAELTGIWVNSRMTFTHTGAINFARAVIAAHEAKSGGAA